MRGARCASTSLERSRTARRRRPTQMPQLGREPRPPHQPREEPAHHDPAILQQFEHVTRHRCARVIGDDADAAPGHAVAVAPRREAARLHVHRDRATLLTKPACPRASSPDDRWCRVCPRSTRDGPERRATRSPHAASHRRSRPRPPRRHRRRAAHRPAPREAREHRPA